MPGAFQVPSSISSLGTYIRMYASKNPSGTGNQFTFGSPGSLCEKTMVNDPSDWYTNSSGRLLLTL